MEKLRERFGRGPQMFGAYCEAVCLTLKIGVIATYAARGGREADAAGRWARR